MNGMRTSVLCKFLPCVAFHFLTYDRDTHGAHDHSPMDPAEEQMLLSFCGVASSLISAGRQSPADHVFGLIRIWLIQRARNVTEPGPAMLVLSALFFLRKLKEGESEMDPPALCDLHHFFEILNFEVNGQSNTYWRMGCAILRIFPGVKFIHPVFEHVPTESIWFRLEEVYWRGRLLQKRSHGDMLKECHSVILDSLRDSLSPVLSIELNCSGLCGVRRSG